MSNHFEENYEWDEDGNKRRRKRVARDREHIHFPVTVMDHAAFGFQPTFADGSPDYTSPHRPGYRFADTNDADHLDAVAAYEARSERMRNAWHNKGEPQDRFDQRSATRTQSLDELRAAAEQAWQERSKRMSNAWRQRQEA